ncbi:hypothetical protein F2981_25360 (plasmid) [Sinorhizobium meliloti]|nr:hypothetical protein [Sinorhizobium meliloti]
MAPRQTGVDVGRAGRTWRRRAERRRDTTLVFAACTRSPPWSPSANRQRARDGRGTPLKAGGTGEQARVAADVGCPLPASSRGLSTGRDRRCSMRPRRPAQDRRQHAQRDFFVLALAKAAVPMATEPHSRDLQRARHLKVEDRAAGLHRDPMPPC